MLETKSGTVYNVLIDGLTVDVSCDPYSARLRAESYLSILPNLDYVVILASREEPDHGGLRIEVDLIHRNHVESI